MDDRWEQCFYVTPKIRAILAKNRDKPNSPWLFWGPVAVFSTVLALVFLTWLSASQTFDDHIQKGFEQQSAQLANGISEKYLKYVDFLLLSAQDSDADSLAQTWEERFKGLKFLEEHPDVRTVFQVSEVPKGELQKFNTDFFARTGGSKVFPVTNQSLHKIITRAFSRHSGGKLVGFDLASNPILSLPLEESATLGRPALSPQLALPISRWTRGEMVLVLPDQRPEGEEEIKNSLGSRVRSYLGLSFLVRDFFRPFAQQWPGLALRVVDKTKIAKPQYLFEPLETTISEIPAKQTFHTRHLLRLGGRVVELEVWATSEFKVPGRDLFNWTTAFVGFLLATLSAFLMRLFSSERETNRLHNRALVEQMGMDQAVMDTVLDAALDCIISIDETGRIVAFNKEAERTLGFLPEEVIGKKLEDCIIPEGDRQAHRDGFSRYLATGKSNFLGKRRELKALRADGRILPVLISISSTENEGKNFFAAHLRDNSERIRAEDALRNRTNELHDKVTELSVLNSISSIMETGATFEEMLEMAAEAIPDAVGDERDIGVKIVVGDAVYLSEGFGEKETTLKNTFFVRGTVQGMIELHFGVAQNIRSFDRHLVKSIASRLTEVCDAKIAEEALRTSEGRFRDIVEIASDWFWEMDENLKFSYLSHRFFETMGVHASEIIGKKIGEVDVLRLVDDDSVKARQNESILDKRQKFRNFEYLLTKADGQQNYIRISGHPLYDENNSFKGYRGAGTDITSRKRADELIREANTALEVRVDERTRELKAEIVERKKAQEALEFSEKRFKDVAEASSDWIWETDSEDRLIHLSERISDLMDVDVEQLIGKPLMDSVLDFSYDKSRQNLRDIWEKHEPFRDVVLKIIDLSNTEHFVKSSGKPVWEVDGTFVGFRGTASDITEQTRSEVTLHRLSRAIEHSPSLILITDPDGMIEYVNPRYEEITGFSLSEVIGDLPPTFRKSKEGEPGFAEIWDTVSAGGEWSGIIRDYKKNGESYWASVSFTSVTDEAGNVMNYIGAAEDVTERREAEEQIRFQASLLKQVRNAVIATGLDGRISYLNKYAEELWGVRGDDVLGRGFSDFVNIGKRPERQSPGWGRIGQDYYEGEFYAKRADGSTFPAFMTTTKMTDGDGEDLGFIRVILDLTDRKKVDAQLVQASKLATIGEMAAGMAHELNQPINIIRMTADAGVMDIDDETEVPESRREVLSLISEQTQRMAEIIDHMRVLSRKDEAEQEQELFSPNEAIIGVTDLIERQFQAEGVLLDVRVPQSGPVVKGRKVQFEQVVLNLMTNARDAIKAKGDDEKRAEGTIKVKVRNDKKAEAVVVTITDTGGGIPVETVPKIFEPFYTTKAAGKGTGLGLSVSMSLIGRMNGSIDVKNAKEGAEFTISLPVSQERKRRSRPSKKTPSTAPAESAKERHILVVDDEIDATRVLAKFFKKHGYVVTTAFDGIEALEFFKERPADIVITDMRMPKMNGKELIETLRKDLPELPIIAVTGQMAANDEKYISQMAGKKNGQRGVQKLFKKPIDLSDLLDAVEGMLQS